MQVAFYLAGQITQVKESIPWVRCASGNVCLKGRPFRKRNKFGLDKSPRFGLVQILGLVTHYIPIIQISCLIKKSRFCRRNDNGRLLAILPCVRPCRPTLLEILLTGVLLVRVLLTGVLLAGARLVGALFVGALLAGALLEGILLVWTLLVRQGLW